jgi:hypothetical protein
MNHQFGTHAAMNEETVVLGRHRLRLEGNESPLDRSQPSSAEISPTKRRSRSRKLIPTVEGDKVIAERFRTKICRNYLQHPDRPCPYEDRCMFAHGDHELRTAAQNLEDGLVSEEAIREFKRKETDSAKSASSSRSSSKSGSAVPFLSRSGVPRIFLNESPGEAEPHMESSQVFQDEIENANLSHQSSHHRDRFVVMRKTESVAREAHSDASPFSDVASSTSGNANNVSAFLPHRQCQSNFPQEWFNVVPGRIVHEDRNSANRSSVPALIYTHDPYSWRAV